MHLRNAHFHPYLGRVGFHVPCQSCGANQVVIAITFEPLIPVKIVLGHNPVPQPRQIAVLCNVRGCKSTGAYHIAVDNNDIRVCQAHAAFISLELGERLKEQQF